MIRPATEEDLPAILAIYRPYVTDTTCSFEYAPPTREEYFIRFRSITAQFPWLVYEQSGEILGFAYASAPWTRAAYRWCAEDSIYLAPAAQGRGVGRALHEELERLLIRQGYRVLYAVITTENRASVAFHKALGYRILAEFPNCGYKFGRWLGVTWMEKRLQSLGEPESFPSPFSLQCATVPEYVIFTGND